jgi:hypothetical protein
MPKIRVGQTIPINATYRGYWDNKHNTFNINWLVLETNGDTEALLITNGVVDERPYHETDEFVTWAISDIRKWLNTDFYAGLSDATKMIILDTEVVTEENAYERTDGGAITYDKLFLLSIGEAIELFGIGGKPGLYGSGKKFPTKCEKLYLSDEARKDISRKDYATGWTSVRNWNNRDSEYFSETSWFLRSPGAAHPRKRFFRPIRETKAVACISGNGRLTDGGTLATNDGSHGIVSYCAGVRPAMWVSIPGLLNLIQAKAE